ncbi:MAG: hypothetical protein WCE75_16485, partial [Terracidiphilus sp.]
MHRCARFTLGALLLLAPVLFLALAFRVEAQAPAAPAPAAKPAPPPPRFQPTPEMLAIQAASEKERQREMDLLGIKELRRGVDSDPKSPYAVNYDERKANVYPTLPDPLKLNDGAPVTTAAEWWRKRRPEIVELFDREIVGRAPAATPRVTWEVVKVTHEWNNHIPVVTKQLLGHVDNSADPAIKVDIDLTLTTPANARGPVPVVVEFGFSREFLAMLMRMAPQFAQMMGSGPSWQQQVLARGWGYAELVPTSYQEDNAAGLTRGIVGLANHGQPRKLDDWGALRAWAWGMSRAIDYFETDKDVDAKQIALEGHSRYGKATLVTMAYEPRLAAAFVSSSGEGGAKLYRHIYGETVPNVAAVNEFHWMAGNFLKYAGPLTTGDLPVDNHELIALCAPRPVFISGGAQDGDGWVDAKGMFLAAAAAGPVYRLLGKRDLGTTEFPPIETPLTQGELAFRQHSGGHTPGPNWPTFLDFAGRYLHGPGVDEPAPVKMTAAEDHARVMEALGLKESDMRPRKAPDARAANATNYDEAKANVYPGLPDALKLRNGQPVATAADWWQKRRPEIVDDFEREILGRAPASLPKVTWEVVNAAPATEGGIPVVTKRLRGRVDNSVCPRIAVNIDMVLTVPAKAAGPVPVMLQLAFQPEFATAVAGTEAAGGEPSWRLQVLRRGWGYAALDPTSVQADTGDGLTEGIVGLVNHGQPRTLEDWGALRAWAWGASRALDYLETDKAVDAKQVGIEGHSRFGKTALVAMAYDPRFAIAYSSSSGEGGAKLYRHIFGEQMDSLASADLYHWFAGNFVRYGGPKTPADLPVDNHELIALSAPRPVFVGAGASTGDGYAAPAG